VTTSKQLLTLLLISGLLVWGAWYAALHLALGAREAEAERRLAIAVRALESHLDQYRGLPKLLADRQDVRALVSNPTDRQVQRVNQMLRRTADLTGSLDIFVMDDRGLTVAASTFESAITTKGQSLQDTAYFQRAMQGGLGTGYGIGPGTGVRGFYFASPVWENTQIIGAIAMKVDLESLESPWRSDPDTILFKDPDGVVFISNRRELVFTTGNTQSGNTQTGNTGSGVPDEGVEPQYPGINIVHLTPLSRDIEASVPVLKRPITSETDPVSQALWSSALSDATVLIEKRSEVLRFGLTAHLLLDAGGAFAEARGRAALATALCVVLGLTLLLLAQRRATLAQRLEIETRANEQLEQRVADRTQELTKTNRQLEQEVEERKLAEDALRRTQNDLIQADKLSALGRMSAGISHELNQPLAAIRSFSDNAQIYLERDRLSDVSGNLSQISALTARMARIIRNLMAFARNEVEATNDVPLDAAISDALELLERRIAETDTEIVWIKSAHPTVVRGGRVRLTQVVMNILSNAMDAMAAQNANLSSHRNAQETLGNRITITIEQPQFEQQTVPMVQLKISDTGPGIVSEMIDQLFEPFTTTKSEQGGEGLGLGLSICQSIVKSFGGEIKGQNEPDGGASFVVVLAQGGSQSISAHDAHTMAAQ